MDRGRRHWKCSDCWILRRSGTTLNMHCMYMYIYAFRYFRHRQLSVLVYGWLAGWLACLCWFFFFHFPSSSNAFYPLRQCCCCCCCHSCCCLLSSTSTSTSTSTLYITAFQRCRIRMLFLAFRFLACCTLSIKVKQFHFVCSLSIIVCFSVAVR